MPLLALVQPPLSFTRFYQQPAHSHHPARDSDCDEGFPYDVHDEGFPYDDRDDDHQY